MAVDIKSAGDRSTAAATNDTTKESELQRTEDSMQAAEDAGQYSTTVDAYPSSEVKEYVRTILTGLDYTVTNVEEDDTALLISWPLPPGEGE